MKVLLIAPVYKVGKSNPASVTVPSISIHVIAALTPPEHTVKLAEEIYAPIDLEEDCDVVGITCMTSNVSRGYFLAQEFKKRGKTVVMGGIHPSILPDEALQYCDAVVIGEAENVWELLLEDLSNGRLKRKYNGKLWDMQLYRPLKTRKPAFKMSLGTIAIETTRGCPYYCNFCTVPLQFGRKQRHKPTEHVINEVVESGTKRIFFSDDNILGNPKFARELFQALTPLGITWGGQSTLKTLDNNPDLLALAKKSGCGGLFFGVESISSAMGALKKSFKSSQILADQLKKVQDSGLLAHTAFIFGFDEDTEKVFDSTLEFLLKNKVGGASFNYLIPYPGTELFHSLDAQKRIFTTDWNDYHSYFGKVVFQPKHFSPEKLFQETYRVRKEFSRFSNIAKGFWANRRSAANYLILNYGMNRTVKKSISHFREQNINLC